MVVCIKFLDQTTSTIYKWLKEEERILYFLEATGVSMVLAYKTYVDWVDATALDFLLLDWLQWYKDMRKMWKKFRKNYKDLISITGIKAFHG